jgi:DNA-directed RNA polymerase specialized sigma24 family protein
MQHQGMGDVALVGAMAAGDCDGASRLYDRYGGAAYGVACCMLVDRGAAEATVVDAFAQAYRDAASFKALGTTVESWLMMLVRQHAIGQIRARMRRASSSL